MTEKSNTTTYVFNSDDEHVEIPKKFYDKLLDNYYYNKKFTSEIKKIISKKEDNDDKKIDEYINSTYSVFKKKSDVEKSNNNLEVKKKSESDKTEKKSTTIKKSDSDKKNQFSETSSFNLSSTNNNTMSESVKHNNNMPFIGGFDDTNNISSDISTITMTETIKDIIKYSEKEKIDANELMNRIEKINKDYKEGNNNDNKSDTERDLSYLIKNMKKDLHKLKKINNITTEETEI